MATDTPTLDRAISDYLAHSRACHQYDSVDAYMRADDRWWDALLLAIELEWRPLLDGGIFND